MTIYKKEDLVYHFASDRGKHCKLQLKQTQATMISQFENKRIEKGEKR